MLVLPHRSAMRTATITKPVTVRAKLHRYLSATVPKDGVVKPCAERLISGAGLADGSTCRILVESTYVACCGVSSWSCCFAFPCFCFVSAAALTR